MRNIIIDIILIFISIITTIVISAYLKNYKLESKKIVAYTNRILFIIFGVLTPIAGIVFIYIYGQLDKEFVLFAAIYSIIFMLNLNILLFHLPDINPKRNQKTNNSTLP